MNSFRQTTSGSLLTRGTGSKPGGGSSSRGTRQESGKPMSGAKSNMAKSSEKNLRLTQINNDFSNKN